MSDHFEAVFSCFLRDDTPDSVLETLRWHLGLDDEEPEGLDAENTPYPLLVPDSNSRLPGGDTASLRRTVQEFTTSGERYEWELFARCYWVDDFTLWLDDLLTLIAPHVARPGYGGHIRGEYGTDLKTITFRGGTYDPVGI
ncbi:hypothetical protein [Streptomyces longispororuber]|uniref:hypothetical protein n=1 Tax=Streptomyces longispororuber TaxID=68230 RepID=UPI00210E3F7D|nr:hypothetical protein [Streptomyces longispororuber]MCQ4209411.1 hypothetical protein [Streptomyces longispororuber]